MDGFIDPILVNRFHNAINNATTLRSQSGTHSFDRRRDINEECGFPEDNELTPERMKRLYERDALAARIVEVWPKECWKVQPEIYEIEDGTITTAFEQGVQSLGASLVSEPGYYKEEEGNSINEYLLRADIMCGIGRYGVILLGLDDKKDLSEPYVPNPNDVGNIQQLLFIRVFDESLAQISQRQVDKAQPRFGAPTLYNITFDNPDDMGALGTVGTQLSSNVHWTRIIHVVDNISSNEIVGQYRCKPVINDILTAQKSRWGSGEMFINGASPKLSFETHPQLGGDVIINKPRMKDEIEKTLRGLQQFWLLSGMTAKTIAPVAVDPKPFTDIAIQSICIKMGMPVPIFVGYEVGENAGTMNTVEWNKRIKERQTRQVTPRLICPFYNRLINLGIIAIPKQGYKVYWPDISTDTDKDKAQLQSFRINIVVSYLKNGLDKLIPPVEFFVRFLEMKEDEAKMLVDKAQQEFNKQTAIETLLTPEPVTKPLDQTAIQQPNNKPVVQPTTVGV